jgi:isoamylase
LKTYPGNPYPLGATFDGRGTNFALYAENASGVELCLYEQENGKSKEIKVQLTERTHYVWHTYIPGIKAGQLYGYRVSGSYEPSSGNRFNANKLLIDPYAKAISGSIEWDDSLFGYIVGDPEADMSFSETDSAPFLPKCVVIDPHFDWEGDELLKTPEYKTVIYEAHVKGLTKMHPEIPENIRGTYAAIAHPVMINYLKQLGVTAIELMPVHHRIAEHHLKEKNLTNYWGYNTIGFFAPDTIYSSSGNTGEQVYEFKNMVKALHREGIEVILDVVYNHTAEGNQLGPTLCFRGIDNASYYRLQEDKRYYTDYTGTGNTLNANLPGVLRLMMDSLRYWITEMHVDGFRFDLAATLARELHEVNRLSAFFDIIYQDPVISQVKLIAEPWDIGEGGYLVGKFPPGWMEWNGKFRDCIRDYWRGADSKLGEFALRLTGSPDLYEDGHRTPTASVNFITAHDGFTLHDLVSYNEKHNDQNGEDNNDGERDNRSWNCGAEGVTDLPEILALRVQQTKNLLTTLFLSQGIPMLVAGDEMGRTQQGNNNAYCQDNEISWVNWEKADRQLQEFTRQLIELRNKHQVFSRRRWFKGQPIKGVEDIAWFLPQGSEMTEEHWNNDFAKSLAVYLNGQGIHPVDPKGEHITDNSFYIMFNAHYEPLDYVIPPSKYGKQWTIVFNTAQKSNKKKVMKVGEMILVQGRSAVLLISRS